LGILVPLLLATDAAWRRHSLALLALSLCDGERADCITKRRDCSFFLLAEKTKMSLHIFFSGGRSLAPEL
jgi:hypothetical protein